MTNCLPSMTQIDSSIRTASVSSAASTHPSASSSPFHFSLSFLHPCLLLSASQRPPFQPSASQHHNGLFAHVRQRPPSPPAPAAAAGASTRGRRRASRPRRPWATASSPPTATRPRCAAPRSSGLLVRIGSPTACDGCGRRWRSRSG